jgi:MFS family permease
LAGSTAVPAAGPEVTLRSLGLSVYLPAFLFYVGDGALTPIVALAARDAGASLAFAGAVVAIRGLGILCFDLPAGRIVGRFGEGTGVAVGSALVAGSLVGWTLTSSAALFAVFAFVNGCGLAIWQLARQAYISDVVPMRLRGRAMSTLGGVVRIGWFLGPFIGAALARLGGFHAIYEFGIVMVIAAATMLLVLVDVDHGRDVVPSDLSLTAVARRHRRALATAGTGASMLTALRAARQVIIPLWAAHVGLSASQASIVFGISLGAEVLLFYPGGSVLDRLGRKAVAVPCLAVMGVGLIFLPLAHSFWPVAGVAFALGVGNGLSSGINMTLAADLAPSDARAQFFGVWRLVVDLGGTLGPLGVAGATSVVALSGAAIVTGGAGLVCAAYVALVVQETLLRPATRGRAPRADDLEAGTSEFSSPTSASP